jgi:hypothetical protein
MSVKEIQFNKNSFPGVLFTKGIRKRYFLAPTAAVPVPQLVDLISLCCKKGNPPQHETYVFGR